MGETLHDLVLTAEGTRCRIYAPVGAHEDLLAYLVRRLLENGANSSFVNQIVDEEVPPEVVAADPFDATDPPALRPGPGALRAGAPQLPRAGPDAPADAGRDGGRARPVPRLRRGRRGRRCRGWTPPPCPPATSSPGDRRPSSAA